MLLPILFLFKTKISDYFKYSKRPEMVFLYVLYEQFNYNYHLINSF